MDQPDNIAVFKILFKLPIKHGFSWGENAPNMSEVFDDPNIIEKRVAEFMSSLGISENKIIVKINSNDNPSNDPDILEINKKILSRKLTDSAEIEVGANSIFTKERDLVLVVKPADCLICIWYGKSNRGEEYIGLIHCSALETDKLIAKNTFNKLIEKYDLNPLNIFVGLTPAISKEYYFVKEGKIKKENWTNFISQDGDKYFLDILGNVRRQIETSGIPSRNIENYKIDTFSSAAMGKTFSHSLSAITGIPEGRFIVVVSFD